MTSLLEPLRAICRAHSLEQAVSKRMRQDAELRQALEESRMAGELLLKAEGEELKRVRQYADELIQKEYRYDMLSLSSLS